MFQDYFSSYRRDDGTNYLQTSRTNHCRYLSNNSSSAVRVYETFKGGTVDFLQIMYMCDMKKARVVIVILSFDERVEL